MLCVMLCVMLCSGMIDYKLFWGFGNGQTDRLMDERTDIGGCRVAFATENVPLNHLYVANQAHHIDNTRRCPMGQ